MSLSPGVDDIDMRTSLWRANSASIRALRQPQENVAPGRCHARPGSLGSSASHGIGNSRTNADIGNNRAIHAFAEVSADAGSASRNTASSAPGGIIKRITDVQRRGNGVTRTSTEVPAYAVSTSGNAASSARSRVSGRSPKPEYQG